MSGATSTQTAESGLLRTTKKIAVKIVRSGETALTLVELPNALWAKASW